MLLALLNSVICASIASFNTVTRMWYAMARSGVGPGRLAELHPRYRTPTYAVAAQAALTLVIGFGFGFWLGPLNAFVTLSLLTTLALVIIYVAGNVGVVLMAIRERQGRVKPFRHVIFPMATAVAVVWVGYKSLDPLPPTPVRWAAIVGAAWLVVGVAATLGLAPARRDRWASDARLGMDERAALEGGLVIPPDMAK